MAVLDDERFCAPQCQGAWHAGGIEVTRSQYEAQRGLCQRRTRWHAAECGASWPVAAECGAREQASGVKGVALSLVADMLRPKVPATTPLNWRIAASTARELIPSVLRAFGSRFGGRAREIAAR